MTTRASPWLRHHRDLQYQRETRGLRGSVTEPLGAYYALQYQREATGTSTWQRHSCDLQYQRVTRGQPVAASRDLGAFLKKPDQAPHPKRERRGGTTGDPSGFRESEGIQEGEGP